MLRSCTACFLVWLTICSTTFSMELPNFEQLKQFYPGYRHHGGIYDDQNILKHIGPQAHSGERHTDTSALRLSIALNKIGGEHRLGTIPIHVTKSDADSVTGHDGLQYIHHTIAYGPFLAKKYQSPEIIRTTHNREAVLKRLRGRKGIMRVVVFYPDNQHADARVTLWECSRSHQSRDWITMHHMISVEFWDLPSNSKCP